VGITAKAAGYNTEDPVTRAPDYGTGSMLTSLDSYNGRRNQEPESNKGLDNLNNQYFPSIVYAISCEVAPFDVFMPAWYGGSINMAESFTMGSNYGGPAFLGNTRAGYFNYSSNLFRYFLNAISNSLYKGHIGIAELVSKQIGGGHYVGLSHNLIGCPEMQMWTYGPGVFDQAEISMTSSSISVNTLTAGSNICATNINTGSDYFSVVKDVSSNVFNTSIRPLYITVTKHNYIPLCYKTNFTSSVSGPSTRASGQNGTYTVSVTGGTAAYHYKWYYRHPSDQQSLSGAVLRSIPHDYWYEIGSDSTQLTRYDSHNFDIKCIVTDSEGFTSINSYYSVSISAEANIIADNESKAAVALIPIEYSIASFPNPFNPTTSIKYSVTNSENVTIKVYNILSQEVATLVNETKAAGTYQVNFNAGNLPSGIYIARIQSGSFTKSIKMQLVK
jgi:hypothetical protein